VYTETLSTDPLIIHEYRKELFGRRGFSLKDLWDFNLFPIQAVMFSRFLFDRYGGLAEELDAFEDWDLWLRYAQSGDFAFVDRVTSKFRMPHSSEVRERRRQQHASYASKMRARKSRLLRSIRGTDYEQRLLDAGVI
jgi:hypothetical protein